MARNLPHVTTPISLSSNSKIYFEIKVIETHSHLVSLASMQDLHVDEPIEVSLLKCNPNILKELVILNQDLVKINSTGAYSHPNNNLFVHKKLSSFRRLQFF
jgi:hypothetical protein